MMAHHRLREWKNGENLSDAPAVGVQAAAKAADQFATKFVPTRNQETIEWSSAALIGSTRQLPER
jgi:hypothetical protein